MFPPRLFLASLLGFTVLADGAASAEDANQSSKAVPDTKPPPTKVISQSVATNDPWRRGSTTAAINLGAGSAVGLLGMTFSYLPLPVLESEIGVGLGYTGWQFSAMQKVALGWGSTRFVAGVGCSYSSGSDLPLERNNDGFRDFWLNFDLVGFEVRTRSHFVFFLAAGGTYKFGKPIHVELMSIDCQDSTDACGSPSRGFAQFRMGFGGWF
jgi:hypothetical protein